MASRIEREELILLVSKCQAPLIPADIVPRPRLFHQLDGWSSQRLTAVHAPPGYGKTTLLASWLRSRQVLLSEQGVDVAWLNLDEDDDDPRQFMAYLTTALQEAIPEAARAAELNLNQGQPDSDQPLRILLNGVARSANTLLLILDDYHHVQDKWIHQAINFILKRGPANLHLMLLSRQSLPPALGSLSNIGGLQILGEIELRFQAEEVSDYIEQILGFGCPSASDCAELVERCDGWVTGLKLAALRLPRDADLDAFYAQLHGRNQWISRYFRSELLDYQSPQMQAFLLETSILDHLSAPLCTAATGMTDAATLLEEVVSLKLFITPTDIPRQRFAYHDLFREMLRAELARRYPTEKIQQLHKQTSEWLANNEEIGAALRLNLNGGLHIEALALVERHCLPAILAGNSRRAERWLTMLHNANVPLTPRLMLDEGWLYQIIDRADSMQWLQATDNAWQRLVPPPPVGTPWHQERLMQWSHAHFHNGNLRKAMALAEQAVMGLSERTHFLVLHSYFFLQFLTLETTSQKKKEAGYRALQICQENGWLIGITATMRALSNYARQIGDGDEAKSMARQGLRMLKHSQPFLTYEAIYTHYSLAYVLYLVDQPAEAQGELQHLITLAEEVDAEEWQFIGQIMNRLCDMALGKSCASSQEEWLVDWRRQFAAATSHQSKAIMQRWLIRLFILSESPAEAWGMARQTPIRPHDSPRDFAENELIAYIGGYLAQGVNLPLIEGFLAEVATYFNELGKVELQVQAAALQAWYWLQSGVEVSAVSHLAQAMKMVEQTGYVRQVIDIPDLSRLMTTVTHQDWHTYASGGIRSADSISRIPLTRREKDILRLLAENRRNADIADMLYISEGTVKWHLSNIYRKLGVNKRQEAVARGRALGLIGQNDLVRNLNSS